MSNRQIQASNLYQGFIFDSDNRPISLSDELRSGIGTFDRLTVDPISDMLSEQQGAWLNTTEDRLKYWDGSTVQTVTSEEAIAMKFDVASILSVIPLDDSTDDVDSRVISARATKDALDMKLDRADVLISVPSDGSADNDNSKVIGAMATKDALDSKLDVLDVLTAVQMVDDENDVNTKLYGARLIREELDSKIGILDLLTVIPDDDSLLDTNARALGASAIKDGLDFKYDISSIDNGTGTEPVVDTPVYSVDRSDELLDEKYNISAVNNGDLGDATIDTSVYSVERVDELLAERHITLTADQQAVIDANPYSDADVTTVADVANKHNFSVIDNGDLGDATADTPTYSVARSNELYDEKQVNLTMDQLAVVNAVPFLSTDVTALANKMNSDGQNLDVDLTDDEKSTIRHRIDAAEPIYRRTTGREVALLGADFSHPAIDDSTTLLITMQVASERDVALETFFQGGFVEIEDGGLPIAERVAYLVISSQPMGTDGILLTFGEPATLGASNAFDSELDLFAVNTEELREVVGGGSGHIATIPGDGDFRTAVALSYVADETEFTYSDGTSTPVTVPLGDSNTVLVADGGVGDHIVGVATVEGVTTLTQGALNTDVVPEGATNLYYTTDRANADIVIQIADSDTDDIAEGANQYFTDARADARVQAGFNNSNNIPQNGTTPDSWDDLGGSIPSTGGGDMITGVTLDADNNVIGVALGEIVSGGGLDQYAVDTVYEVGDVVWLLADLKLYAVTTGHTSGATLADFNASLWSELSSDGGVTSVSQNDVGGIDVVQDGVTTTLANEIITRNDHSAIWNMVGSPPNSLGATGSLAVDDTGSGIDTIYVKQSGGSWDTLALNPTSSPVAGIVTGVSGTNVNLSATASGNRLNVAGNGTGEVRYGDVVVEQLDNAMSIRMNAHSWFGGFEGAVVDVIIDSNTYESALYTYQSLDLYFVDGLAISADGTSFILGDGVWSFTATPLIDNSWTAFG